MSKKILWVFDNIEYIVSTIFSGTMICLLFIQVISRYIFRYSLSFTEELSVVLFILSVYFGAIGATRRHQHLKIELLTNIFSERRKIIANIISDIFFIVANTFLTIGCVGVTSNLYVRGMTTAITGMPKWIFYAVIPFALTIITIRLIQEIIVFIRKLKNEDYETMI